MLPAAMPSSAACDASIQRLRELQTIVQDAVPKARRDPFRTDLSGWDRLLPGQCWPRGTVHELLADASPPLTPASILASRARESGLVAWIDPEHHLYPPALVQLGLCLRHVLWIHPQRPRDRVWAIAECLRCPGIDAVVATPPPLSRIEARRLQLAAESGGGIGILLRPARARQPYAASTRWLINPAPAPRGFRRWNIQLLHGHGGLVNQSFLLEISHETGSMRTLPPLADRSSQPAPPARAYA